MPIETQCQKRLSTNVYPVPKRQSANVDPLEKYFNIMAFFEVSGGNSKWCRKLGNFGEVIFYIYVTGIFFGQSDLKNLMKSGTPYYIQNLSYLLIFYQRVIRMVEG